MGKTTALIFGYNQYAIEIINNVQDKYESVRVFSLQESEEKVQGKYTLEHFELSDTWEYMFDVADMETTIAFCVLEDTAENIFLTIALRSNFENLKIIALASNQESANKLSMAGANKVVPLVETTADIITNMLEKPITSRVLHNILYEESDLKIAQIKISKESNFQNLQLSDIDWSRYNGIIVLSVMHGDMSSEFIYSSKMKDHVLEYGDILVVVGYEADIQEFEKKIGSKRHVNWSNWSW